MNAHRFYNDDFFLPTIEEKEANLLEFWEMGNESERRQFEKEFEADDPEAFKHFRDHVLSKHPEYKHN